MIGGGGVVAQGHLLPHIQKQLGVAAAAEQGVAQQHRAIIVAAAGETHAQLALSHVHLLGDHTDLRPRRVGRRWGNVSNTVPGQGGKSGGQRLPHPIQLGAADIDELQPGGGDQLPILGIELFHLQLLRGPLIAQAAHTVGFPRAHLLQQPGGGIVPLVVDLTADGVDEVGLLRVEIGADEPTPLGDRVADQLSHQLRRRLQQLLPAWGEAVVNEAGHKAHALVFAFFPHRVVHGGTIQPVQLGGQGPQVRVADGAPAQNRRQQRPGGGGLLPQRRDELSGEQAGFELSCRQIREIHAVGQLDSHCLQGLNSFWE